MQISTAGASGAECRGLWSFGRETDPPGVMFRGSGASEARGANATSRRNVSKASEASDGCKNDPPSVALQEHGHEPHPAGVACQTWPGPLREGGAMRRSVRPPRSAGVQAGLRKRSTPARSLAQPPRPPCAATRQPGCHSPGRITQPVRARPSLRPLYGAAREVPGKGAQLRLCHLRASGATA